MFTKFQNTDYKHDFIFEEDTIESAPAQSGEQKNSSRDHDLNESIDCPQEKAFIISTGEKLNKDGIFKGELEAANTKYPIEYALQQFAKTTESIQGLPIDCKINRVELTKYDTKQNANDLNVSGEFDFHIQTGRSTRILKLAFSSKLINKEGYLSLENPTLNPVEESKSIKTEEAGGAPDMQTITDQIQKSFTAFDIAKNSINYFTSKGLNVKANSIIEQNGKLSVELRNFVTFQDEFNEQSLKAKLPNYENPFEIKLEEGKTKMQVIADTETKTVTKILAKDPDPDPANSNKPKSVIVYTENEQGFVTEKREYGQDKKLIKKETIKEKIHIDSKGIETKITEEKEQKFKEKKPNPAHKGPRTHFQILCDDLGELVLWMQDIRCWKTEMEGNFGYDKLGENVEPEDKKKYALAKYKIDQQDTPWAYKLFSKVTLKDFISNNPKQFFNPTEAHDKLAAEPTNARKSINTGLLYAHFQQIRERNKDIPQIAKHPTFKVLEKLFLSLLINTHPTAITNKNQNVNLNKPVVNFMEDRAVRKLDSSLDLKDESKEASNDGFIDFDEFEKLDGRKISTDLTNKLENKKLTIKIDENNTRNVEITKEMAVKICKIPAKLFLELNTLTKEDFEEFFDKDENLFYIVRSLSRQFYEEGLQNHESVKKLTNEELSSTSAAIIFNSTGFFDKITFIS